LTAATVLARVDLVAGRHEAAMRRLEAAFARDGAAAAAARHEARLAYLDAMLSSAQPDLARVETLLARTREALRDGSADLVARALAVGLRAALAALAARGPESSNEEAPERARLRRRTAELAGLRADGLAAELELELALTRARAGRVPADDDEGDRASAEEAERRAMRLDVPLAAAEARALLALARERRGDSAGAEDAERDGREELERAVERIGDDELARAATSRGALRRLRRPAGLAEADMDRRLVALYEMIRSLNSADDPDQLLSAALDMAIEVVDADRGMILLQDGNGEHTVRVSRHLQHANEAEAAAFSRNIVAEAAAGKAVLALDGGGDARFNRLRSLHEIRSLICVPLRSRDRIVGTVYLDSKRGGAGFHKDNLRFVEAFADHAALALENARARRRLTDENRRLQAAAESRVRFGNLVGDSPEMLAVFELIRRVSASELPVLIQGESGTGKELVARAIHFNGPRRKRSFIGENCAALPDSLLQSELFGHVRGAFTGADRDRSGLFELADGGTLFLDEVGDMSPSMQAQLLRALQEGEIRRVGDDRPIQVDVRVVAATHRDLAAEAAAGRFREDLLYRLQVLVISIPPLRRRPGDIALLASHLLRRAGEARGRAAPPVDGEVLELFERYAWPGNVRQLESAIQRLVLLAGDEPISLAVVERDPGLARTLGLREAPAAGLSLGSSEKEQIRRALEASAGNRTRAARMLGISRATIYRKLREHGLQ
jgi:Nif-specific regulatory protein